MSWNTIQAGKALFGNWDITGFEKIALGCGDMHYLFMAEKVKKVSDLFGNLNEKLPFLCFWEAGQHYEYELFLFAAAVWGSRGVQI